MLSTSLLNQILLVFLGLIVFSVYFLIAHVYFTFSLVLPPSFTVSTISSLLPCRPADPRESWKKAHALYKNGLSLSEIDKLSSEEYSITNCMSYVDPSKGKFIIIVPYRDRKKDLLAFLLHMPVYFRYQGAQMEILVAEQNGSKPFNRAKLFNAALREIIAADKKGGSGGGADRLAGFACFALHDVDKLPDNPDVPYVCHKGPHQLLRYWKHNRGSRMMYATYLGGVTMFSREQLEKMNGASNVFVGWGGEDDDMWRRIKMADMKVVLPPVNKGEFYEGDIGHKRVLNPSRWKLLARPDQKQRMLTEGLRQVNYSSLERRDFKNFVWLLLAI